MNHLLTLSDLSHADILGLLDLADDIKKTPAKYSETLKGKNLAMVFSKASTRTRVSFETGIKQLGGFAVVLTDADAQTGRGEPIRDTARVLSRYCDAIMIRTFAQSDVEDLAKWGSVPVINGLTDFAHPCQILADLQTIREHKGTFEGLTVAWVGDGNNVANSLIAGASKLGVHVRVATPAGHVPDAAVCAAAGDALTLTTDPRAAVQDADVVFTDVWASMGQEQEAAARRKIFEGFQVNADLLTLAKPNVMVQHCLPAHRGEEITEDIFEAHANEIFDEAENRLHAQKAVLVRLIAGI